MVTSLLTNTLKLKHEWSNGSSCEDDECRNSWGNCLRNGRLYDEFYRKQCVAANDSESNVNAVIYSQNDKNIKIGSNRESISPVSILTKSVKRKQLWTNTRK